MTSAARDEPLRAGPGKSLVPVRPEDADALLAEAVETLRAIRAGEVDALVVADGSPGEQVFTLSSADRPYRMFVENMRDGAATLSEAGIILYANRRLAELLGRPLSRLIGASLPSLVTARHRAALAAQSAGTGTGGTVQVELIGHDDQPIPVRVGAWDLEVDAERLVCLTFTDLTQAREDQEELSRAREAVLDASRVRSAFAANAILLPLMLATLCVVLLMRSGYAPIAGLAVAMAAAALIAVMGRLALSFRAHAGMLTVSREEALTDALTGLGNRRSLVRDLHRRLAEGIDEHPAALALFDLNGFKHYNDTFGHQSGDALLARLGVRLSAAVSGCGRAYRMGGDEFCALIELGAADTCETAVQAATDALSERGDGFSITPAHGRVELPLEAQTASEALRISDQRMYANKQVRRPSASRQSRDVLCRALVERGAELGAHLDVVGPLAEDVARYLGRPRAEVEQIRHAGDLHDVGKVAVPDEILHKAGPLDPDEWAFIHRHTLVGERIVSAAPALVEAGVLVRSSHERWDGDGYPHGLSGQSIPLGSRIVAVCDAYDAMVSERPYSRAMSRDEALTELRLCAGSQFDPSIVTAFEAVMARPDHAAGVLSTSAA
jgi:diguanylate cyclase (GGDEF)-like protein/PAS domain S-box-containing protein